MERETGASRTVLSDESDESDESDGADQRWTSLTNPIDPRPTGGAPRQGCLLHSPAVEARSADDPGLPAIRLIYTTPIGCRSLVRLSMTTDPWRGRGEKRPSVTRGRRGCAPPTPCPTTHLSEVLPLPSTFPQRPTRPPAPPFDRAKII